ncbi:MAG: hypothetical protein SNJ53_06280, partial [Thermodesulfovibrionales bacterium]
MKTFIKVIISLFSLLIVFLFALWHIVITDEIIESSLSKFREKARYEITTTGIKKGLFYSLKIGRIEIKDKKGTDPKPLISLENIQLYPCFSSILRLKPIVRFSASGVLDGSLTLTDIMDDTVVYIKNFRLADAGFLGAYGIKGDGLLDMKISLKKGQGEWMLDVKECRFDKWKMNDIYIPLDMFDVVRGVGSIRQGGIDIT